MMGQLLGNLLNVVLDPLFILVFHWEITGAAIATVIGNVVGAGYYIAYCSACSMCWSTPASLWCGHGIPNRQHLPPGACLHSRHVPAGRGLSRAGTHLGPARGDVLSLLLAAALYMRKSRKMMD